MLNKATQILLEAQQAINNLAIELAEDSYPLHASDFRSRLLFADLGNGLDIEYYGDVWADGDECAWAIFLQTLAHPEVAERLTSLRITGADEGANGSRTHDFALLLKNQTVFPKLALLFIRPTGVSDHNFVDIKDGQIAPLIALCPNLEALTLPNAPEAEFFDILLSQLRYLRIGMAWRTYGFIRHMAARHNMPALRCLDFADSLSVFQAPKLAQEPLALNSMDENTKDFMRNLGYGEEMFAEIPAVTAQINADLASNPPPKFDDSITPFADYCALIQSPSISENMVVHLRNVKLTEAQFKQLNRLKKVQLTLSLEAPHVYISHWEEKFKTPYQHLIIQR